MIARPILFALAAIVGLCCNLGVPAQGADGVEIYMHLKPGKADFRGLVLDLHLEDPADDYSYRFVESLPVEGLGLVVQTDSMKGMSRRWLRRKISDKGSVFVSLSVKATPSAPPVEPKVFSNRLKCSAVRLAKHYSWRAPGLLCLTQFDGGDSGEFFVSPVFQDDIATEFIMLFRSGEQDGSAASGSAQANPWRDVLFNGEQPGLHSAVTAPRHVYRNARPRLRYKTSGQHLDWSFVPVLPSTAN